MGKNVTNYFGRRNKIRNDFRSKLKDPDVKEIRRLRKEEGVSYAKIALRYGLTEETMRRICVGVTWQHIQQ